MCRLVDRASGQPVQSRLRREPPRHPLEEVRLQNATVVVGEGDEIRADLSEGRVAGAREPSFGAQPHELERALFLDDRCKPFVLVLVDEQHAGGAVRLCREGVKQAFDLGDTPDGRDDKIEGREPLIGHAPYANRPCPSSRSSSPSTTVLATSTPRSTACWARPCKTSS